MNLMGIDVGTTSIKTAVFDEKFETVYSNNIDYTLNSHGDIVECEPQKYWNIIENELKNLKVEVSALAVDTQCETLILTDENGNPIRDAIVWLDNRAEEEAKIIDAHFGKKRVYEVTGQPEITATWPASKLFCPKYSSVSIWSKNLPKGPSPSFFPATEA